MGEDGQRHGTRQDGVTKRKTIGPPISLAMCKITIAVLASLRRAGPPCIVRLMPVAAQWLAINAMRIRRGLYAQ